jgi:acetylornithine deacetylase/succinyl-diaminopimelate desuccinylase-like protein
MTKTIDQLIEYYLANKATYMDDLISFVSIPSVSTDPAHTMDIRKAAEWLLDKINKLGAINTRIISTPKHPVVIGEILKHATYPTILVYGHYDVQPAEPLDLWKSDPFAPQIRGDNIYGRGISDMKGQLLAVVNGIDVLQSNNSLHLNIKFLFEGEEEIGSPNLSEFLQQFKKELRADFVLNLDGSMVDKDTPSVTIGIRGLAYFELIITGPDHDLHSGIFGGAVHNPANVLCDVISGMHDENGRVTLPGFYDGVRQISQQEKEDLARLPINEEILIGQTGAPALWGEAGYTPTEQLGIRPTLDVNGLLSGFTGTGSKTVIPSWAMAKFSMRLVPSQNENEIIHQVKLYLTEKVPPSVKWNLVQMGVSPASTINPDLPSTKAFREVLYKVWGVEPVLKHEGGSIPVVGEIKRILGMDTVLSGFALPDDNAHSPNEKLHIPTWYRGIEAIIHFLYGYKG